MVEVCKLCKDTGVTCFGMYEVEYCHCHRGGEEYKKRVLNAVCFRCHGTGRFLTHGGSTLFCHCRVGVALQYPTDIGA